LGTTASVPITITEEPTLATTWSKILGGFSDDYGSSIQQTTDGGYIIMGSTLSYGTNASGPWLIKLDSWGNKVWDKVLGVTWGEGGYLAQQTSDGGYIIFGSMRGDSDDEASAWLLKTDAEGTKVWEKIYGGYVAVGETYQHCIGGWPGGQQTFNRGYLITGRCFNFNSESGQIILRLITYFPLPLFRGLAGCPTGI